MGKSHAVLYNRARKIIIRILNNGPVECNTVFYECLFAGIGHDIVYSVFRRLKIVKTNDEYGNVMWELPAPQHQLVKAIPIPKPCCVPKRELAKNIILEMLSTGSHLATDIIERCKTIDISMGTVKLAKKELKIKSVRRHDGCWWWTFP